MRLHTLHEMGMLSGVGTVTPFTALQPFQGGCQTDSQPAHKDAVLFTRPDTCCIPLPQRRVPCTWASDLTCCLVAQDGHAQVRTSFCSCAEGRAEPRSCSFSASRACSACLAHSCWWWASRKARYTWSETPLLVCSSVDPVQGLSDVA